MCRAHFSGCRSVGDLPEASLPHTTCLRAMVNPKARQSFLVQGTLTTSNCWAVWQLVCSKNPNSYHRVKIVIKLFLRRGTFVKKSVSFYPSTSGSKKLTQLPTQFYLLLDNHDLKKLMSPLHFHWPWPHLLPTAQIISWAGPCCHVGSMLLPSPPGWVIMNWTNQHSNNWNKPRLAARSLDGSGAKRSYRLGGRQWWASWESWYVE